MDGKTGQTLLKTALASMFRARNLKVVGWYSVNFLGNNDGLVLDNPGSNKTKVMSKAAVLDSILGYRVENHQVHIHYYKPRGDAKEAWDNIDLGGFCGVPMQMKINFLCQDSILGYRVENHQVHIHYYKPRGDAKEAWDNIDLGGFCGIPMQMKINFLCQDSALAAPLVLDLVRLLDVAQRAGERGVQEQFAMFFKSPWHADDASPVHDFFVQERMLLDWARKIGTKEKGQHKANGTSVHTTNGSATNGSGSFGRGAH